MHFFGWSWIMNYDLRQHILLWSNKKCGIKSLNLYLLRMAHNLKIGEYVPPSLESHQAALTLHDATLLLIWNTSPFLKVFGIIEQSPDLLKVLAQSIRDYLMQIFLDRYINFKHQNKHTDNHTDNHTHTQPHTQHNHNHTNIL